MMQLAVSIYWYPSYDNIADICKAAFVDSEIAQNITMNKKKVSYIISDDLDPTFSSYFTQSWRAGQCLTSHCILMNPPHIKWWNKWTFLLVTCQTDLSELFWCTLTQSLVHAEYTRIEEEIIHYLYQNTLRHGNWLYLVYVWMYVNRLQCFKSAWMMAVLHHALGFPLNYHWLTSAQTIKGHQVHWSLGALLYKTKYFPLRYQLCIVYLLKLSSVTWELLKLLLAVICGFDLPRNTGTCMTLTKLTGCRSSYLIY